MGMGAWSPDKVSTYNLEDPPLRDTNTVLFNGTTEDKAAWVALRCGNRLWWAFGGTAVCKLDMSPWHYC